MKYFQFLCIIASPFVFCACGDSSQTKEKALPPVTGLSQPAKTTVQTTTSLPVNNTVQTSAASIQPVSTAPVTTAPVSKDGLNPEHGKPGHRCDIAVGAPLDSKPAQAITNNNTQPITISQPVQTKTTQPAVTGAGLNPEHGKPGHRCDIAVGAPLNSQPTNTPVTKSSVQNPITATPQQPVSIPQPVQINNTQPVVTGAGLNPEHGKPGHRCDIAVGAPLSSVPTAVPVKQ